jgi:hypothetical protein
MVQTAAFCVSQELATAKRDKEILIKTGPWAYLGAYGCVTPLRADQRTLWRGQETDHNVRIPQYAVADGQLSAFR